MNNGESTNWPEQETAPAFALPKRDFDGGLLRRWTYTLTAADALTVLRLPKPWSRWQRWGLGGAAVAWGALVALLPPALVGPFGSPRFEGVLVAGAVLGALGFLAGREVLRRRQAKLWLPTPRLGCLEEWIDCIAITRLDVADEDYLSPELIAEVRLTRRHLLVFGPRSGPAETLIVPLTAFANQAEAVEVATYLTALAKGPYYFDP